MRDRTISQVVPDAKDALTPLKAIARTLSGPELLSAGPQTVGQRLLLQAESVPATRDGRHLRFLVPWGEDQHNKVTVVPLHLGRSQI